MTDKVWSAATARWIAGGVLGALVCSGCAATGKPPAAPAPAPPAAADSAGFPPPEALDALGPEPTPAQLKDLETVAVERWELAGPFPEQISERPATYQGGFGAVLLDFVRQRPGTLAASADMACVARETGRFILAHGARPPQGLRHFIGGRCGSVTTSHQLLTLSGESPAGLDEDGLLEHWREQYDEMLAQLPLGGRQSVGVWFGRQGSKVVVVVTSAERVLEMEPLSFSPGAAGTVSVKGKVLIPATYLEAIVTRGRFQYGACEVDPTVRLPQFSVRCAVSVEDPEAWLDIVVFPPGRFLGQLGAGLLFFPRGKGSAVYARPVLRAAPGAPGEDGARFTHLLNGLRAEQGLAPVALSEGQSRVARKVAPLYFASASGATSHVVADTVVKGLLAGWEVGQVHREAFFADWVGVGDPGVLLAEMLSSPGARRTLFDPDVRTLAIGPLRVPAQDVLGLLVTTYAPFEDLPPEIEAREVIDALNLARLSRGVGPAELVVLPAECRADMDKRLAGRGTANDALRAVLQRAVKLVGRSVKGSVLQAGSIERLPFSDDLLQKTPLVVYVAVTHHRQKGDAWGRYVVALAYADEEGRPAPTRKPPPPPTVPPLR